ncbi:MAG: proline dehydrogenase family protein [Candidatus Tectomicrobia bacterium]|nr:proline dehydrogenase family protein [Candidatus Tectomicrobia bacterium]
MTAQLRPDQPNHDQGGVALKDRISGDANDLLQQALALAADLLRVAQAQQTEAERSRAEKIARMMEDPRGKDLTIALADQAFRSHQPARVADQLSYLLRRYGAPSYMEWWERTALTLGSVLGEYLPSMVVPPLIARLRQETRSVILPGEESELRHYLRSRYQTHTRLNLNQLGEAILGEAEAHRRLNAYLELLGRDDVEYISVKVSSILSQINLVAFDQTVTLVKERLRTLYRQALAHHYHHPDGRTTPKFINLDMEEYRDLHLTVAAFRQVLDEPEFLSLRAGIVLQAYVPDSYAVQQDLTQWAISRVERGGAGIKVRIVKGANLAMERVEAGLHGWPQAPYTSKVEVDANFKRMMDYGCRPEHTRAVHLGIGSHNLFDIAYALRLRSVRGVEREVEFEMLEGMANHQARAVQQKASGILLYAPVVKSEDFHSAIAYLVRRLDENTAPENFLHDLFGLKPDSPAWHRQQARFLEAYARMHEVSAEPRRTQDRRTEQPAAHPGEPFENTPDTDWSLPANQIWIQSVLAGWRDRQPEAIPLQINGGFVEGATQAQGHDPSRPGVAAYTYAQAGHAHVVEALDVAVRAQPAWEARAVAERRAILLEVSAELARRRGDLLGAMLWDSAKAVPESDAEVSEAVDFARYYARALDLTDVELADCAMRPLGVVVVTPPWNFPLAIPAGGVLAALMAGNSVILKPAPEATLVGWHLAQALWDAGVPKEVLQFLPCPDNDVGKALVTDDRVGGVILTGSLDTARLFQDWKPDMRLFAETSGKNSLIITAMADQDQAVKDLVRSAFGHNGQKCSAASLAICEAEVYDSPTFRRQLRDATASLQVGSAWDLASVLTPLTQPPSPKLIQALTALEPGEEWLLEPQPGDHPQRWSPGIKLGVQPGTFFHQTECFGPVLGLMRAENLDDAIDIDNNVAFGLTSGIHSLDAREIVHWKARIQAGNLYVNRHITGAIVQRQPFGGWKASSVGPGAKAGGPNYVLQFAHWQQVRLPKRRAKISGKLAPLLSRCSNQVLDPEGRDWLRASAKSYAWHWQAYFSQEHDPSRLSGESNVLRYQPCRGLIVRLPDYPAPISVAQVILAVRMTGQSLTVSLSSADSVWSWLVHEEGISVAVEDESGLAVRLQETHAYDRLRLLGPVSEALRRVANEAGIHVIDAAALANGRLELRHYLREQAISHTMHRYGNILPEG